MTDADVGAILAREEQWAHALAARDAAAVEDILAAGYALELVQPAAVVMGRDEWLRLLPEYVVHTWDVQERVVAVDGDVATVLMRVAMQATVAGQDRSGLFAITDVWRRAAGDWRVWRRHSTPLHAGAIPRA
jgi:ketosteroid isomerase-like protein